MRPILSLMSRFCSMEIYRVRAGVRQEINKNLLKDPILAASRVGHENEKSEIAPLSSNLSY